jgi:hypothetical protein
MTDQPPARQLPRQVQVLIVFLAGLPRTAVFLGALALLLVGLFLPGVVGTVLLLLIAAAMVAVLTLTWPTLGPQLRAFRVLVLALVVAIAVGKLFL